MLGNGISSRHNRLQAQWDVQLNVSTVSLHVSLHCCSSPKQQPLGLLLCSCPCRSDSSPLPFLPPPLRLPAPHPPTRTPSCAPPPSCSSLHPTGRTSGTSCTPTRTSGPAWQTSGRRQVTTRPGYRSDSQQATFYLLHCPALP